MLPAQAGVILFNISFMALLSHARRAGGGDPTFEVFYL